MARSKLRDLLAFKFGNRRGEDRPEQPRARELIRVQAGCANERCSFEIRAAKIRAEQIGFLEICLHQARAAQVRKQQFRAVEIRAVQNRALQIDARQIGGFEVGASQLEAAARRAIRLDPLLVQLEQLIQFVIANGGLRAVARRHCRERRVFLDDVPHEPVKRHS